MIGTTCWSAKAGAGTGSVINFDFGGKIKRDFPIDNPHLTPQEQAYVGEWGLFTNSSYWTLVVDGWVHVNATFPPSTIREKAAVVIGKTVQNAVKDRATGVLTMLLNKNIHLTVYPYLEGENANYTVFQERNVWDGYGTIE